MGAGAWRHLVGHVKEREVVLLEHQLAELCPLLGSGVDARRVVSAGVEEEDAAARGRLSTASIGNHVSAGASSNIAGAARDRWLFQRGRCGGANHLDVLHHALEVEATSLGLVVPVGVLIAPGVPPDVVVVCPRRDRDVDLGLGQEPLLEVGKEAAGACWREEEGGSGEGGLLRTSTDQRINH